MLMPSTVYFSYTNRTTSNSSAIDLVACRRIVRLANIAIAVGRTAQNRDFAGLGPMFLAAPRPFENLYRSYSAIMPWNCSIS